MNLEFCAKCAKPRTRTLEVTRCGRGGSHAWNLRRVPELAIDCMTCRRRLIVHGVPFVGSESDEGRVREALRAPDQHARVGRFLRDHGGHKLETSRHEPPLFSPPDNGP